jgi:N-acetyl sugar amidotransferase
MNRCKRCCIPDTRPDTAFVDGVCSACLTYEKRPAIDWDARRSELLALLERHNGRCIVPSSGGKDSTWQVLTLLELGAEVTVVTASTCHLTPIGRANIDNLAWYARTIEISPKKSVRAKLNRLGLTMVGDISWPEHVAIFSTPFKAAVDLGIPLIFFGENPQAEYGGPLGSEDARQMTRRWTMEYGGFLGLRPSDMVGVDGITERDMQEYMLPSDADMQALGVEAHFLGQYLEWDSRRNAEVAIAHGMKAQRPTLANWWDAENLDNAQTGIHDHAMYRKFGYGRGCAQISVDVRAGLVSREEALKWVLQHDGLYPFEYAGVQQNEVLDRIDMRVKDFFEILHNFTNWDLFSDGPHGTAYWRPRVKESA